MIDLGDRLNQRGVAYVEANVAGSSAQLRDGEAVLLIGGDGASVKRIEALLESIERATIEHSFNWRPSCVFAWASFFC